MLGSGTHNPPQHNKAYADLAAGAMARVRSRLMGYQDDGEGSGGEGGEGSSAAQAVLRALLHGMYSTEERATFLPDAFTPPGLQVRALARTWQCVCHSRGTMLP